MIKKQYIKEIYRENEVCPECGKMMKIDPYCVLASYPPQYRWECPQCHKVINSTTNGMPIYNWREDENDSRS